jgi:hypothetical protein
MAMTTSTIAELVRDVLIDLNVIRAEGSPTAIDAKLVSDTYAMKFLELEDAGLTYWPVATIPDLVYLSLVKIIAAEVSGAFGYSNADPSINVKMMDGMDRLYKIQARKSADEPVEIQSY